MSRKAIRDAVKTRIDARLAGVFEEVSIGRRDRLPKEKLPAACIYTNSEEIEPLTLGAGRDLERTVEVVVKIFAVQGMNFSWSDLQTWLDENAWFDGAGDSMEDQLDAMAYAIEDALTAGGGDLGLDDVLDIVPARWEVEGDDDDTDARYLLGTLTFICTYTKDEAA